MMYSLETDIGKIGIDSSTLLHNSHNVTILKAILSELEQKEHNSISEIFNDKYPPSVYLNYDDIEISSYHGGNYLIKIDKDSCYDTTILVRNNLNNTLRAQAVLCNGFGTAIFDISTLDFDHGASVTFKIVVNQYGHEWYFTYESHDIRPPTAFVLKLSSEESQKLIHRMMRNL